MNMSVEHGDVDDYYCYTNSSIGFESKNHNCIDYKNKRNDISTNIYLMENNGLTDDIGIDDMLPASALNQYSNM